MFRTIYWFTYFFAYLIWMLPALWKADKLRKQGKEERHHKHVEKITSTWARSLLNAAGITVHVHGRENLPKEGAYLIVSNHQGNFDIPILIGYLERKISFISKVEVKKIPIIPRWMEHMNCVFMDRKNRRQSIMAILEGAKNLEEGHNVVIFPEGTRSKGMPVGIFKNGSFKLATKAKAPILPVTINGSFKVMEANNNLIRPAEVHLTISPVVTTHLQNPQIDPGDLSEIVKKQIESNLTDRSPAVKTM